MEENILVQIPQSGVQAPVGNTLPVQPQPPIGVSRKGRLGKKLLGVAVVLVLALALLFVAIKFVVPRLRGSVLPE